MEPGPVIIYCSKIYSDAKIPRKGTSQSAGYDLYAFDFTVDNVTIPPRERRVIGTGIRISFPQDWYGRIAPRSGLALNFGIDVLAGVVDRDYSGEIKVILYNSGDKEFIINRYDRIAQIIPEYCGNFGEMIEGELDVTERGEKGFGSTGV